MTITLAEWPINSIVCAVEPPTHEPTCDILPDVGPDKYLVGPNSSNGALDSSRRVAANAAGYPLIDDRNESAGAPGSSGGPDSHKDPDCRGV